MEIADYSFNRTTPIELTFSFENNTDAYDFLKYSFSTYNKTNQIVAEGYDFLQTAPSNYRLAQSYPNPFTTGGTTIEFDLPVTDTITMNILDIRGRKVRTLINKEQLFGYQAIMWDAKDDDGENVSSGVYFYQIKSRNFNEVGKLVFVKQISFMLTSIPTLSDIKDARIRTESIVRKTPILTSEYFNELLGMELFFKC